MLNLSHFHVNATEQTKQGRLVGVTHSRTTHMVGVKGKVSTRRPLAISLLVARPLLNTGAHVTTVCSGHETIYTTDYTG